MTMSVHTNTGAMIALQNLNKTNDDMLGVQNRINTGLKISGAKDNAAIYAVAQGMRADIRALEAVQSGLDRASTIGDVALAAGESISDLLVQMREKATAAMDPSPLSMVINLRRQAEASSATESLFHKRVGGWIEWDDVHKARRTAMEL